MASASGASRNSRLSGRGRVNLLAFWNELLISNKEDTNKGGAQSMPSADQKFTGFIEWVSAFSAR